MFAYFRTPLQSGPPYDKMSRSGGHWLCPPLWCATPQPGQGLGLDTVTTVSCGLQSAAAPCAIIFAVFLSSFSALTLCSYGSKGKYRLLQIIFYSTNIVQTCNYLVYYTLLCASFQQNLHIYPIPLVILKKTSNDFPGCCVLCQK